MNRRLLTFFLSVALLAGCSQPAGLSDSTPHPGAVSSAAKPTPISAWQQQERALAERILPFAVQPICEWQPVAADGDWLYAWVFCQDQSGVGSAVSVPARITTDAGGAFTLVEVPGVPAGDYCREVKTLFPPSVRPLLDEFNYGAVQPLISHAAGRTSPSDPPLAVAVDPRALALPVLEPTPTPPPAPAWRWRSHTLLLAYAGPDDRVYVSEDFGPPVAIGTWDSCTSLPLELAWSPDGSTLAYPYSDADGSYLALYERASGVTQFRLVGKTGRNLAWSPDGQWLAWTEGSGGASLVRVISVEGAAEQVIQPADRFWWLAGSRGLVYQTRAPDGDFMTTDLSGKHQSQLKISRLEDPNSRVIGFARPAGALLIWRENARSGTGELWRASIDGVRLSRLLSLPGKLHLGQAAVSADGRFVVVAAYADGDAPDAYVYRQVRLASGTSETVPPAQVAAWTPNGDYLLGTEFDATAEQTWLVVDRLLTGERVYRYPLAVPPGLPALGLGWAKK